MSEKTRYIDVAIGMIYIRTIISVLTDIQEVFAEIRLDDSSKELSEKHSLFLKKKCEKIIGSVFDRKTDKEISDAFIDVLIKGLVGALAESLKDKGGKDENDNTE